MAKKIKSSPTFGVVDGCFRLNVRKEPNVTSEIVSVIPIGTKVKLGLDFDAAWWKVVLDDGSSGYALKQYIKTLHRNAEKQVKKLEESDGKHTDIDKEASGNR